MASDQLAGKSCVVTGGSSGIGEAVARLFAANGGRVAVLDVQRERGQQVVAELQSSGAQAMFIETDMLDSQAVNAAQQVVLKDWQGLDVWVNVAGGSGRKFGDGPTAECSEAGWDATLDLNLKTTFLGCKAALAAMLPRGRGAIVNVSSVLGLVGGDADFATHAYAASKGAIISLTRSIAVYYAPQHIRANVICPGLIETPMSRRAQADARIRARLADLQPLTADFGTPQDVAHSVLYLASDQSRFVTGAVLAVDGGWTAR